MRDWGVESEVMRTGRAGKGVKRGEQGEKSRERILKTGEREEENEERKLRQGEGGEQGEHGRRAWEESNSLDVDGCHWLCVSLRRGVSPGHA